MTYFVSDRLATAWEDAIGVDDAYCEDRVTWLAPRNCWNVAAQACREAGPAFDEMRRLAESASSFYDDHKERAMPLKVDKRYRTPWRSRW